MPRASRSAQQAVAWGRGQHRDRGREWRALCLSFVRQSWGLPGVYPSAKAAWHGARKRHNYTGVDDIPYGAAVFSDRPGGSTYGHVFLAGGKTRGGKRVFWSNDISISGGISPVTIDAFTRRWGHEILGWTEDLNGYDLNLPGIRKRSRPTTVERKHIPGWWHVDTRLLNGRTRPSTSAKIKFRRRRGRKVYIVRAVRHEGRIWFRTNKATWYAAEYLKPGKGGRR